MSIQPDLEQQLAQTHGIVSADPESDFLDAISSKVYPDVKRHNPDVSLAQIRYVAEGFRGAKVREYIPIFVVRSFREGGSLSSIASESAGATSMSEAGLSNTPRLPFIDRLKRPFQAMGIKL